MGGQVKDMFLTPLPWEGTLGQLLFFRACVRVEKASPES